jgi:hypothetical protein
MSDFQSDCVVPVSRMPSEVNSAHRRSSGRPRRKIMMGNADAQMRECQNGSPGPTSRQGLERWKFTPRQSAPPAARRTTGAESTNCLNYEKFRSRDAGGFFSHPCRLARIRTRLRQQGVAISCAELATASGGLTCIAAVFWVTPAPGGSFKRAAGGRNCPSNRLHAAAGLARMGDRTRRPLRNHPTQ